DGRFVYCLNHLNGDTNLAAVRVEDGLLTRVTNHDGVVSDAYLLDAGVIFGTGFAPFRGGPIEYIKSVGPEVLLTKLQSLQAKYGARFAPRPGWDSPTLRD
ncbi:MAG: hypothetical protein WKF61_07020, partial [Luteimonas sp.]